MKALFVTIHARPGHRVRLPEELWRDARGAERDEPGCLGFDVAQGT